MIQVLPNHTRPTSMDCLARLSDRFPRLFEVIDLAGRPGRRFSSARAAQQRGSGMTARDVWLWLGDTAHRCKRHTRAVVLAVVWPYLYEFGYTDGYRAAAVQSRRRDRADSHEKGRQVGYRAGYQAARRESGALRLVSSQPAAAVSRYTGRHSVEAVAS